MATRTETVAGSASGPAPAASDSPAAQLTAPQLHALFDILTHHETYREIQDFRDPDTIYGYGTPFVMRGDDAGYAAQSSAPILHMLFNRTVMTLPPAKTLPRAFWHTQIQGMVAQLAEAELSESYDQGALGTRKMLATASSALIESLGRGALGGYPTDDRGDQKRLEDREYDTANAADFARAWDDVLRAMVCDDLVDGLFAYCAEQEHAADSIEGHSAAVRAAADYIIVHVAEFLHYIFVQSPNGRYLTKLVDCVQQLVPYSVVRQTLRVSNAATMINGMMKLLLAKLSVVGLTNWMGLTSAADDGMNLLQRIVSLVLSYDASSFKKAAERIEKDKDKSVGSWPQRKAQLAALREHLARPRAYHEAVRRESAALQKPLVVAILESVEPSLVTPLPTEAQHTQLAQYYAALLAIHDRREITNVFCRQSPDLFTQALRDGVAAFDPIIRGIHDKIDLKEHVSDIEGFVNEFIEVSKGVKAKRGSADERILPTVKDYVELLRRNRHLLYKWLHRVAHDTPNIRDMFRGWAVETIKLFRGLEARPDGVRPSTERGLADARLNGGAGAMDADLQGMFDTLPADTQTAVLALLDAHVVYLCALDEAAAGQRQALLDKINAPPVTDEESAPNSAPSTKQALGSGRFIARWQELLDDTTIGPGTVDGPLRHGRDVAHVAAQGKTSASSSSPSSKKHDGFFSGISSALSSRNPSPDRAPTPTAETATPGRADVGPRPPDVLPVVEALGQPFRQLLVERSSKYMTELGGST